VGLATNNPNRIQRPIFAQFTQSRSLPGVRALFVPAIKPLRVSSSGRLAVSYRCLTLSRSAPALLTLFVAATNSLLLFEPSQTWPRPSDCRPPLLVLAGQWEVGQGPSHSSRGG
jgi:hypothetical protein